jgi:IS5 family transposase
VTRGRKLRVDTTAVETDIHFPTDSGLIGDGVRVVSRLLRRARAALSEAATGLKEALRSQVRTVRKLSQQLRRIARRKGDRGREALKAAYGRLVAAAKRTGAQGRRVLEALRARPDEPGSRRLAERLAEVLPRLKRVIGCQQSRENDPLTIVGNGPSRSERVGSSAVAGDGSVIPARFLSRPRSPPSPPREGSP